MMRALLASTPFIHTATGAERPVSANRVKSPRSQTMPST